MHMLSVANCWPPIEWRHPEMDMGRPFRDARRTASASSWTLLGVSSSRTRVQLSCEWMSLSQISPLRSAKRRGASANNAVVRMNSRRVNMPTFRRDYEFSARQINSPAARGGSPGRELSARRSTSSKMRVIRHG